MKRLPLWFLHHTILRFSGCLVTLTMKSGAKIRFRCDDDWKFKHTSDNLTQYSFSRVRNLFGTPMTIWFVIEDVAFITVRRWRIF